MMGRTVTAADFQLIGGREYAGRGWQMLMECLSIGRSITLPSTASGGSKAGAMVTGAYARIRKQFGLSVGRFEGVQEALARIGGKAYAISALSQATAAAVDRGDVPAVPTWNFVAAHLSGVPEILSAEENRTGSRGNYYSYALDVPFSSAMEALSDVLALDSVLDEIRKTATQAEAA